MKLMKSQNQSIPTLPYSTVITKDTLKHANFTGADIGELCGPASVAMLLEAGGHRLSIQEVVSTMRRREAFIAGVGTILSRVPRCFEARLFYLPYVPMWLLRLLLRRGYSCAHSIKHQMDMGGHIVFVYAYRNGAVYMYDPNNNTPEPTVVTAKDWHWSSNRRAVFMKIAEY